MVGRVRVGKVGTLSSLSQWSAKCLANVVGVILSDVANSSYGSTDGAELREVLRQSALQRLKICHHLLGVNSDRSEYLKDLANDGHGELAFGGRSLSHDLESREQVTDGLAWMACKCQ